MKRPPAPDSVSLTEAGDSITITVNNASAVASTGRVEYVAIYASYVQAGAAAGDYGLIALLSQAQVSGQTSITLSDNAYTLVGKNYYKVYNIYNGVYSLATSDSITPVNTVSDVSNLTVSEGLQSFTINYDIPDDRRLESVGIYKDASASAAGTSLGSASLIKTGLGESYTYYVPDADINKYHQFWVSSTTRTS